MTDYGAVTISRAKFDKRTLNAEQLDYVIRQQKTTDNADYIRARQEKKQEETFGAMFEA